MKAPIYPQIAWDLWVGFVEFVNKIENICKNISWNKLALLDPTCFVISIRNTTTVWGNPSSLFLILLYLLYL
jgi:hypothetical protein